MQGESQSSQGCCRPRIQLGKEQVGSEIDNSASGPRRWECTRILTYDWHVADEVNVSSKEGVIAIKLFCGAKD
jgi:hypothetical protein